MMLYMYVYSIRMSFCSPLSNRLLGFGGFPLLLFFSLTPFF